MRDLFTIMARLHWLWSPYPGTPKPWKRCHCGALATIHEVTDWCSPCKYAIHDTCECSQPERN